eukprot:EG_transcript_24191
MSPNSALVRPGSKVSALAALQRQHVLSLMKAVGPDHLQLDAAQPTATKQPAPPSTGAAAHHVYFALLRHQCEQRGAVADPPAASLAALPSLPTATPSASSPPPSAAISPPRHTATVPAMPAPGWSPFHGPQWLPSAAAAPARW